MRRRKKENIESSEASKSVLKAVEFPDRSFENKSELFSALKKNEDKIISCKTSTIKDSENCSFNFPEIRKGETTKEIKGLVEGKIAAIINTTNYIDSHNDVHFSKIWNKSVKEQKGKVYYVTDHELKVDSIIAFPEDVEMKIEDLSWKELGKDFEGNTEALTFIVSKDKIQNEKAFNIIEEKRNIEHSVRMQYVKIFLALNSEEKEDKEYKKRFDKNINEIANKEIAIDRGYFWGVTEAKVFKEGSMVLFGSNDVTPLIYPKEMEPNKITPEIEPLENTRKVSNKHKRRLN